MDGVQIQPVCTKIEPAVGSLEVEVPTLIKPNMNLSKLRMISISLYFFGGTRAPPGGTRVPPYFTMSPKFEECPNQIQTFTIR